MTCREKMMIEHPEKVDDENWGGVAGCPHDVGYLSRPEYCNSEETSCIKCWDREILEEDSEDSIEGKFTIATPRIKDSGNRRQFESGAVRDIHDGKGRCDLLPLDIIAIVNGCGEQSHILRCIDDFQERGSIIYLCGALEIFTELYYNNSMPNMFLEVSKQFEDGAKKYSDNNWKKGIPVRCYIDSAVRHYLKFLRGDTDEPHDRAFCWNIICAIWTCNHKPELNDYKKENDDEESVL